MIEGQACTLLADDGRSDGGGGRLAGVRSTWWSAPCAYHGRRWSRSRSEHRDSPAAVLTKMCDIWAFLRERSKSFCYVVEQDRITRDEVLSLRRYHISQQIWHCGAVPLCTGVRNTVPQVLYEVLARYASSILVHLRFIDAYRLCLVVYGSHVLPNVHSVLVVMISMISRGFIA